MVSRSVVNAWKLALMTTLLQTSCYAQERDIRLFGGRGSYEGRVEVRVNGRWGTVCNDTWDSQDASVLCRELDNRTAIRHDVMYGEGVGPIFYSNVMCTGGEQRLQDCSKTDSSLDVCQHSQDAGVQCSAKELDLRLSGGSAPNEGRVEVYYRGNWGRVCAGSSWDKREADVVCRVVGYPTVAQEPRGSFGSGSGAVFLVNLMCAGTENTVMACSSSVSGPDAPQSCPDGLEDATVICNPNPEVVTEQLSTGAIAGISVGFGLVIVVCCIFSLNCKCKDCCRRGELDDTDVYQCNTASNADSKVFSTTSNLKSDTDNRNDSISDIDPNMFVFVPPAGFGASSGTGESNNVLSNIDETKEPDREVTESDKKDDPIYHTIRDEQKTSKAGDDVTMTTDENTHEYDYVARVKGPDNAENESETVTIDLQGDAHFAKKNHDHGNTEQVENNYLELEDIGDSFQNGDVGKEDEGVSMEQQAGEQVNISMTNEDTPLESRDQSESDDQGIPKRVENDYLELENIDDSFQNRDVGRKDDSGDPAIEREGEHTNIGMANENTPLESRDQSESDDQGIPKRVENDYLELENIDDSFQNRDVGRKDDSGDPAIEREGEHTNIGMANENTPLESRDQSESDDQGIPERVENDYLELENIDDSFQNRDVGKEDDSGGLSTEREGAPLESRDESHAGLTSHSEGAEPVINVDAFDSRL
ncbi:uncharacterized protein LOC121408252 [Lytechinus variegatus]|uniref:uncharacterized protein LOC121408252 n=1 Tax=Lytechinus variegatus TaxID=7654 RepID=UPI001BB17AC2|nr:uncharacterized protein LOC121408252 [Lytechinus variegatus]